MKNYQDSTFGKKLGQAVKKLRERNNMSQEELRQNAKLSTGYISRLEAGDYSSPSIAHIFLIAQALQMTLRDLLEFARLIPEKSSFEACLRGEGYSEEQVKEIIRYKNYVLASTKNARTAS